MSSETSSLLPLTVLYHTAKCASVLLTDQSNPQFSNLTIQLDVHIGYYTGALTTQDHGHPQSQNSSMDRMLNVHAVTWFQV